MIASSNFLDYFTGEYMGNQCRSGDTNCKPCSQRLPSCIGRPDGNVPVIGQYWSPDYLICLRNRTISVTKCQTGLFDPVNRRCTLLIDFSEFVDKINIVKKDTCF